jgi:hypothetical protein
MRSRVSLFRSLLAPQGSAPSSLAMVDAALPHSEQPMFATGDAGNIGRTWEDPNNDLPKSKCMNL